MPLALFYLFAALMLGFGLNVVIAKNPVTSALSLAMCFVGLAALFISLDAYFLGIIQILVYTGAVMVLFLFIIMLLDIKAEEGRKFNMATALGGVVLAVVLVLQVSAVLGSFEAGKQTLKKAPLSLIEGAQQEAVAELPTISNDLKDGTLPDAKLMGLALFHHYGFHLQVMGLLLVVGTVGVVALSKKEQVSAD